MIAGSSTLRTVCLSQRLRLLAARLNECQKLSYAKLSAKVGDEEFPEVV